MARAVAKSFQVVFAGGQMAPAVRVARPADLPAALRAIGLTPPRPGVVLIGGAAGMSEEVTARLRPLAEDRLAPLLERLGAAVVDGGTAAGVMEFAGRVRAAVGVSFPLVGVAAEGTVALPGEPGGPERAALDPNHTHFVLVPGAAWGDESPWLSRVADVLTGPAPSATIVINGGQVTLDDVEVSVRAGRPVLVVGGSGRLADELFGALRAEGPVAAPLERLVDSGLLRAVQALDGPGGIVEELRGILEAEG